MKVNCIWEKLVLYFSDRKKSSTLSQVVTHYILYAPPCSIVFHLPYCIHLHIASFVLYFTFLFKLGYFVHLWTNIYNVAPSPICHILGFYNFTLTLYYIVLNCTILYNDASLQYYQIYTILYHNVPQCNSLPISIQHVILTST